MRIAELRKGDIIRCCDVEQVVEHVAMHPAGTVVIMQDGAQITAQHLDSCGWSLAAESALNAADLALAGVV